MSREVNVGIEEQIRFCEAWVANGDMDPLRPLNGDTGEAILASLRSLRAPPIGGPARKTLRDLISEVTGWKPQHEEIHARLCELETVATAAENLVAAAGKGEWRYTEFDALKSALAALRDHDKLGKEG